MKKQLILAICFVFALAIFTPAVASVITNDATATEMRLDDDKKKEATKKSEKKSETKAKKSECSKSTSGCEKSCSDKKKEKK